MNTDIDCCKSTNGTKTTCCKSTAVEAIQSSNKTLNLGNGQEKKLSHDIRVLPLTSLCHSNSRVNNRNCIVCLIWHNVNKEIRLAFQLALVCEAFKSNLVQCLSCHIQQCECARCLSSCDYSHLIARKRVNAPVFHLRGHPGWCYTSAATM